MAREIPLTKGLVALVDDADFELVAQYSWRARLYGRTHYAEAPTKMHGILTTIRMHSLIMEPGTGLEVDHRNHNGLDNRRENLRVCTHRQNCANRRYERARPGYRGVYPSGANWKAVINRDGRQFNLGHYPCEVMAAVAFDRELLATHGEFAKPNFSPERDWILPEPSPRPVSTRRQGEKSRGAK